MSRTGPFAPRLRLKPLWWSRPSVFLTFVLLPAAIVIGAFSTSIMTRNGHGYVAPNYISAPYLAMYLLCVVLLIVGARAGERQQLPATVYEFQPQALELLFWVTALAYAVWFGPAIVRYPSLVLGALLGQPGASYAIRDANLGVRGVTTLTQFGLAYISIFSITKFLLNRPLPARYSVYAVGVFAMALFRAVVNSERIAVLELVFPFVLIYGSSLYSRQYRPVAWVCKTFPLLTILGAPVFFAIFEYNRSWTMFYQYKFNSIFAFALERLLIYYVTALNNIAGYMQVLSWPTYDGEMTMEWLLRAPVISSLYPGLADEKKALYMGFLGEYATEEFNNATGALIAFHDWGIAGGTLYFLLIGLVTGRAFVSFTQQRGVLLYAFPMMFYSLYETLRIPYVLDGRCVAGFIGMGVCAVFWGGWRTPRRPAAPWIARAPSATR